MLVKDWCNQNVVTIEAESTLNAAIDLLKKHDISILPVMNDYKLVGVITDRDIRSASASNVVSLNIHELLSNISKIKIAEIMTTPAITVPWNLTVEETAEVLLRNRISGVPVVDDLEPDQVMGIITQKEIFKVIISLTGVGKKGVQIAVELEDRTGSIKEITDIIRGSGGRMTSILSSYDKAPTGYRHVYIRFFDIEQDKLELLKEKIAAKAKILYVVNHSENYRNIYP